MTKFLSYVKVVLIDLSGTIHIEDSAISGSIEALKRLRNSQKFLVKFVTNTTKESKQTLLKRLTKIGFGIDESEIFTSLTAASSLVDEKGLRPFYLLSEDAKKDFSSCSSNDLNAVVVGLAPEAFTYENMTQALRLLLSGAPLIAIHKSRYFKRKDGLAIGPGAYVQALEYSSGVQSIVVGKPEPSFFLCALKSFNVEPHEAIMIGDDAKDDVEGAMKAGLVGCLVKTGKYMNGDEKSISDGPLLVVDDFSKAVDYLLQSR